MEEVLQRMEEDNNNKWDSQVGNHNMVVRDKDSQEDMANLLDNMVNNKIHTVEVDINNNNMETHMDNSNKVMEILMVVSKDMEEVEDHHNKWEEVTDNKVREEDQEVIMQIQVHIMEVHHHQCHTDQQSNKIPHQISNAENYL